MREMEEPSTAEEAEWRDPDNETQVGKTETGVAVGAKVHLPVTNLDISQWLPWDENIPSHPSIGCFGKRRTGKSTTIKNFAYWTLQHVPFGIVLSNTSFAGAWEDVIPKRWIFQGLREDIIDALMARQKRLISKLGDKDPRTFAFCILDDVIADQKAIRWNMGLQSFFVEGRHLNITVIIASQNVKGVGPMIRGNLDYAFIQPIRKVTELDALWELFGGQHFTKREWRDFNMELVAQHTLEGSTAAEPRKQVRTMVIADFEVANKPEDMFFWWSPVHVGELPKFRLLHKSYWEENGNQFGARSEHKLRRLDPVAELEQVNSVLQDVPTV